MLLRSVVYDCLQLFIQNGAAHFNMHILYICFIIILFLKYKILANLVKLLSSILWRNSTI